MSCILPDSEQSPFDFYIVCPTDDEQKEKLIKKFFQPTEKIDGLNLLMKSRIASHGMYTYEVTFNPWKNGIYSRFIPPVTVREVLGEDFENKYKIELENRREELLSM